MMLLLALVNGFVNLPSYMIPDSSEVLLELLHLAGEVGVLPSVVFIFVVFNIQHVHQLLNNSLEKVPSINRVTLQQRTDFLEAISTYV